MGCGDGVVGGGGDDVGVSGLVDRQDVMLRDCSCVTESEATVPCEAVGGPVYANIAQAVDRKRQSKY